MKNKHISAEVLGIIQEAFDSVTGKQEFDGAIGIIVILTKEKTGELGTGEMSVISNVTPDEALSIFDALADKIDNNLSETAIKVEH
jgi:hypothetical protein